MDKTEISTKPYENREKDQRFLNQVAEITKLAPMHALAEIGVNTTLADPRLVEQFNLQDIHNSPLKANNCNIEAIGKAYLRINGALIEKYGQLDGTIPKQIQHFLELALFAYEERKKQARETEPLDCNTVASEEEKEPPTSEPMPLKPSTAITSPTPTTTNINLPDATEFAKCMNDIKNTATYCLNLNSPKGDPNSLPTARTPEAQKTR